MISSFCDVQNEATAVRSLKSKLKTGRLKNTTVLVETYRPFAFQRRRGDVLLCVLLFPLRKDWSWNKNVQLGSKERNF